MVASRGPCGGSSSIEGRGRLQTCGLSLGQCVKRIDVVAFDEALATVEKLDANL